MARRHTLGYPGPTMSKGGYGTMVHGLVNRRRFGLMVAVLLLALTNGVARAGAFPAAEQTIERLVEEIAALLVEEQEGAELEIEQLASVLNREADLDLLGRLALGRHWRAATPEQQAEYEEVFRGMMLRRFAGYLNAYSGNGLDGSVAELIEIRGSREVAGGDIMVDTLVSPPAQPPINVMWRLRERNGTPAVIDLIVEEISLLITQRQEFSSVIEREGMDGLLAQLRTRLEQTRS